jgi:hypothetical protein
MQWEVFIDTFQEICETVFVGKILSDKKQKQISGNFLQLLFDISLDFPYNTP